MKACSKVKSYFISRRERCGWKCIYKEGELAKDITCANFAHMGADADQTYNTTLTQSARGRLPRPLTGPRNDRGKEGSQKF